jgi:hypothetical protein
MPHKEEVNEYIYSLVLRERERQEKLHGEYNASIDTFDFEHLGIIMEELGEAAEALQYIKAQKEYPSDALVEHYLSELVQTAASCWAVVEKILGKEGFYGKK